MFFATFSSLQREHEFLNRYVKDHLFISTGTHITSLKPTGFKVSVWEDEKVLEMVGGDEYHYNVNILNAIKLHI